MNLTMQQVRWFRLRRSGLKEPFASPEEAARRLAGVQAQIEPAAGLALWNRTRGLDNARFTQLLYTERTLVKLWGQRGTLHAYACDDWPLLHAARSVNRTWWERMADDDNHELSGYDHHLDAVLDLLRERETLGRSDLRASGLDLHEDLYSPWGGIFADLVRHGHACHAQRANGEGRFALRQRWVPDLQWEPPDPDAANVELARRFFAVYAPASAHDFAYWRGVSLAQCRGWMAALQPELCTVTVEGETRWALAADKDALAAAPPSPDRWPVRLLYRFEPLLLGNKEKGWVAEPEHYKAIWRPAGHIEGIVLARGRAAGTWRYDRKGSGIAVTVNAFRPFPAYVRAAVERHAAGVAAFFGKPLADLRVAAEA